MHRLTICLIVIILILFLLNSTYIRAINSDIELLISKNIVTNPVKISDKLKNYPVFIINFKHRVDRRLHISNVMEKLGFVNYSFVEPVSREEILRTYLYDVPVSTLSRFLTNIKIFNLTKAEKFFIFEDDVDIYNNTCSIDNIIDSAEKTDYDLIFFEICYTLCHQSKRLSDYLYLLSQPNCNGAMLYTRKFVDKFFNYIENIDITKYACDTLIIEMEKNNIVKCVGYPYFRQNPTLGSEIETSSRYNAKHISYDPLCRVI